MSFSLKYFSTIHHTAKRLAIRDIRSEFRQSFIGVAWLFLTPIINTLLWLIISQSGLLNQHMSIQNLGVYIFSGTLMWQTFVESFNMVYNQINANKSILSKINFEREALILSGIYKQLVNTIIRLTILFVLVFWLTNSSFLHISTYAYPILGFLSLMLTGFALGLVILPFIFLFNDLNKLIQYGLQLWMYISPVVFIKPQKGILSILFNINFLSIPLQLGRQGFYTLASLNSLTLFIYLISCILTLIIGLALFRITMPIIIERMSN